MPDYSPNCIMMLPAYARRVTTGESETMRKSYILVALSRREIRNILVHRPTT